jgi:hypothetical protein
MPVFAVDPGDLTDFRSALDGIERDVARKAAAIADPSAAPARVRQLFETILRECGEHRQLQVIGLQIAAEVAHEPSLLLACDHEGSIRLIRDRADNFYRALWLSLTDPEKLLLTQIAQGHLVNPRCGSTLSRLLAHRLLARHALGFRLINASFGRFIVSTTRPDEVATWEREGTISLWAQLRAPIMISLLGGAGFLIYTVRDVVPPVLTGLGVAVPALVKLLDLLRPAVAKGQGDA